MKEYQVADDIRLGICEHCRKKSKYGKHGLHVVKVTNLETGEEDWRCNNCVKNLSSSVAHKLANMDLERVRTRIGTGVVRARDSVAVVIV